MSDMVYVTQLQSERGLEPRAAHLAVAVGTDHPLHVLYPKPNETSRFSSRPVESCGPSSRSACDEVPREQSFCDFTELTG